MQANVLRFPTPCQRIVEVIGTIGFTGEPVKNDLFPEEVQEKLLYVLDTVFDGRPMDWLARIVQILLDEETAKTNAVELLELWADEQIDISAPDESEQFI